VFLSPDLILIGYILARHPWSLIHYLNFWGAGSGRVLLSNFIRSRISKVASVLGPFSIKRYGAGDLEPCGFHHSVASLCGPSPQSVDSAVTWSTIKTWTNLMGSALWISPSSSGISLWSCGPHVEFLRQFLTTLNGDTSQNVDCLSGGNHLGFYF
jgi:hypothetical protein